MQAEIPGVLRQVGRQTQPAALLGVQTPSRVGGLHPTVQQRQLGLGDAEARAQCRHLQQVKHIAHRQPALRQAQQLFQRAQQRIVVALTTVGQRERDVARIVALQQAEHCLHMRRIGGDVGHHHDHVAWLQRRIGGKRRQQLVVQHRHLALRTMRDVESDGAIRNELQRWPGVACFCQRA